MTRPLPGWWSNPPAIARYGGALAAARWIEANFAGAPVSLFSCAVLLSGWFGGFGAGFFAAALATLAFDYEFVNPLHSLAIDPKEIPRFALFAATIFSSHSSAPHSTESQAPCGVRVTNWTGPSRNSR
jgi:K+-sensing histidine kinase KdpD